MFKAIWTKRAENTFSQIEKAALEARKRRQGKRTKSSKQEGLFKQIYKTIQLLEQNPRHPGLHTHEYTSLHHPYDPKQKVFEAYAQHKTPGAYRVFWCYGPDPGTLTILAITPHP